MINNINVFTQLKQTDCISVKYGLQEISKCMVFIKSLNLNIEPNNSNVCNNQKYIKSAKILQC